MRSLGPKLQGRRAFLYAQRLVHPGLSMSIGCWMNCLVTGAATIFPFFFFCCKKLYCFHLFQGLGEGSRVVKKLPSGCREGLQAEALTPEGYRTKINFAYIHVCLSVDWFVFNKETYTVREPGLCILNKSPVLKFQILQNAGRSLSERHDSIKNPATVITRWNNSFKVSERNIWLICLSINTTPNILSTPFSPYQHSVPTEFRTIYE